MMMTDEEQHELKDAALVTLAKMAISGSASYEHEIDVLRGCLQRLYYYYRGIAEGGGPPDEYDWKMAWEEADRVLQRTDWRAP